MRYFYSYIKYNVKWLLIILFCEGMMTALMVLNHVPEVEILYGILLCVIFLLVIMSGGFYGYYKKYLRLREMEQAVTVSLQGLPETDELLEAEYQKSIKALFEEKTRLENDVIKRERDLAEYYTMWVHQIKTPIAALNLLLQEADKQVGMSEELQELFRIEQYVEMALQYMRLGAEATDFILKKVELDSIIREAVHKYARQFIRRKISLNYDKVAVTVLTDEKWMEFVLEQLLSNAIKYTPKGSISIYMEQGRLVIADTGIGISSEDLPRVFEKGYTGYNGHADKRSTGIGLYLCSQILKKLGHTLVIMSEEGKGTRVLIGFPEGDDDSRSIN